MLEHDFYSQGEQFLRKLHNAIDRAQINLRNWSVDHLCYRSSTLEEYRSLKKIFSQFGECLVESQVNGRPISTFKLKKPFRHDGRITDLVELPAPKPGKVTVHGFEHIEVVCDLPFEDLENEFSCLKIDLNGLKKHFNPELEIELEGGSVKFHHLSLESVIQLEQNAKVYSALEKSKVLTDLKGYRPVIVGTFPLDIANKDSDLDILLSASDLSEFEIEAKSRFERQDHFNVFRTKKQGIDSCVVEFKQEGVSFELFAQTIPSVQQSAFGHFLVEERLLKLGGSILKAQIQELRKTGIKTEPAFAQALGLSGDPYAEILKLKSLSENELIRLFFDVNSGNVCPF